MDKSHLLHHHLHYLIRPRLRPPHLASAAARPSRRQNTLPHPTAGDMCRVLLVAEDTPPAASAVCLTSRAVQLAPAAAGMFHISTLTARCPDVSLPNFLVAARPCLHDHITPYFWAATSSGRCAHVDALVGAARAPSLAPWH